MNLKRTMAERRKRENALTGVAGAYFVAAELSRQGYIALLTLRNTRGPDILASNADGTKHVSIQVKTNRGREQKWLLNEKAEDTPQGLKYVFVRLNELDAPEFHIVPGELVAKYVRDGHQAWLASPGRGGRAHVDNSMRNFEDPDNQYRDRWDLLGLD